MPRLARAALNSDRMRVLVSSRSKYRNVLSNCSSCAGVMLVMFLDTICHTSVCEEQQTARRNTRLIVDERDLLSDGLSDEFEFEVEVLPSKHSIVVFLDIGFSTIFFSLCYTSQGIG